MKFTIILLSMALFFAIEINYCAAGPGPNGNREDGKNIASLMKLFENVRVVVKDVVPKKPSVEGKDYGDLLNIIIGEMDQYSRLTKTQARTRDSNKNLLAVQLAHDILIDERNDRGVKKAHLALKVFCATSPEESGHRRLTKESIMSLLEYLSDLDVIQPVQSIEQKTYEDLRKITIEKLDGFVESPTPAQAELKKSDARLAEMVQKIHGMLAGEKAQTPVVIKDDAEPITNGKRRKKNKQGIK